MSGLARAFYNVCMRFNSDRCQVSFIETSLRLLFSNSIVFLAPRSCLSLLKWLRSRLMTLHRTAKMARLWLTTTTPPPRCLLTILWMALQTLLCTSAKDSPWGILTEAGVLSHLSSKFLWLATNSAKVSPSRSPWFISFNPSSTSTSIWWYSAMAHAVS